MQPDAEPNLELNNIFNIISGNFISLKNILNTAKQEVISYKSERHS